MARRILILFPLLLAIAGGAWFAASVPAMGGPPSIDESLPSGDPIDGGLSASIEPLDLRPFAVSLWYDPPPLTPVRRAPPPRIEPVRVRLVAILGGDDEGSGTRRAALFDESSDRLRVLGTGESIAGVEVASIEDRVVRLRGRGREWTLELSPPPTLPDIPIAEGSR
ncbi:MAG: hypothetical protein AAFQ71_11585 [Planctomycetota bacterium]